MVRPKRKTHFCTLLALTLILEADNFLYLLRPNCVFLSFIPFTSPFISPFIFLPCYTLSFFFPSRASRLRYPPMIQNLARYLPLSLQFHLFLPLLIHPRLLLPRFTKPVLPLKSVPILCFAFLFPSFIGLFQLVCLSCLALPMGVLSM